MLVFHGLEIPQGEAAILNDIHNFLGTEGLLLDFFIIEVVL